MKTPFLLLFLVERNGIIFNQVRAFFAVITIKDLINSGKDIIEALFYITTGLIAYFTYRRAKITVLQPVRTEKQLKSLNKLLQYINQQDYLLEAAVDYNDIVRLNIMYMLVDFGYLVDFDKITDKLKIDFDANMSLPCGENKLTKDKEYNELPESDEKSSIVDNKNGINLIYVTHQYLKFTLKISEFEKDPYMPSKVSVILQKLQSDINHNLCIILKEQLELIRLNCIDKKISTINVNKEINHFNNNRIQHQIIREKIRSEIREYLRIDEV